MDRATLERLLAQAEEHVALGEQHIAGQGRLVSELWRRDGPDAALAEAFMSTLEES